MKNLEKRTCVKCGKEFEVNKSNKAKHCSKKCGATIIKTPEEREMLIAKYIAKKCRSAIRWVFDKDKHDEKMVEILENNEAKFYVNQHGSPYKASDSKVNRFYCNKRHHTNGIVEVAK